MGLFGDIGGKKAAGGGVYLLPGNYRVEVTRCFTDKAREGYDFFCAELKILASDSTDAKMKPGSGASYFVKRDLRWPDLFLGNVADFMRAGLAAYALQTEGVVLPLDETGLDGDKAAAAATADEVTDNGILNGTILDVHVFEKEKKTKSTDGKGDSFTHHRFSVPLDLVSTRVAA